MHASCRVQTLIAVVSILVATGTAQQFQDPQLSQPQCVFVNAYSGATSNCLKYTGHALVFNFITNTPKPQCSRIDPDGHTIDDFNRYSWNPTQFMPTSSINITSFLPSSTTQTVLLDNNFVCITEEQTTTGINGISTIQGSIPREALLQSGVQTGRQCDYPDIKTDFSPQPPANPPQCLALDYCRHNAGAYYHWSGTDEQYALKYCYPYLWRLRSLANGRSVASATQMHPFQLDWMRQEQQAYAVKFYRSGNSGSFDLWVMLPVPTCIPDASNPSACASHAPIWTVINGFNFSAESRIAPDWKSDEPGPGDTYSTCAAVGRPYSPLAWVTLQGTLQVPLNDSIHATEYNNTFVNPPRTSVRLWCKASLFCDTAVTGKAYDGKTRGCSNYGQCPTNTASIGCNGHGSCTRQAVCACTPGYAGVACEQHLPTALRSFWGNYSWAAVANQELCADITSPVCGFHALVDLFPYYMNPSAQAIAIGSFNCSTFNPCGPMAICVDNPATKDKNYSFEFPSCICYEGWSSVPESLAAYTTVLFQDALEWTATHAPSDCSAGVKPCFNGGICHTSGICLCLPAFGGEYCEINLWQPVATILNSLPGTTTTFNADDTDSTYVVELLTAQTIIPAAASVYDITKKHPEDAAFACALLGTCITCDVYNPCGTRGTCVDPANSDQVTSGGLSNDYPPFVSFLPTCKCQPGWYGVAETDRDLSQAAVMYSTMTSVSSIATAWSTNGDSASMTSGAAQFYLMLHPCSLRAGNINTQSTVVSAAIARYSVLNQCRIWMGSDSQLDRYMHVSRTGDDNDGNPVQPLWYFANDQLNGLKKISGVSDPYQMHTALGYNCADKRVLETPTDYLFGGPNCEPCPLCLRNNSMCVSDNSSSTSTTRVCSCFENWGGVLCDYQLCPWNRAIAGHGACGKNYANDSLSLGTCVVNSTTVPHLINGVFYYGTCSCFDGFSGDDCTVQVCPVGPNGKICSGTDSKHARSVDVDVNAHGFCNETSQSCVCYKGWTSGLTAAEVAYNACDLAACPLSTGNQLECNGLLHGSPVVSVCNRAQPTASCNCTLNATSNPLNNFYGTACDIPYSTVCSADGGANFCSQTSVLCSVDSAAAIADGTAAPRCHCKVDADPAFPLCNVSVCVSTQNPVNACHIDDGTAALSTGKCVQFCGSKPCPTPTSGSNVYGCQCLVINPTTGLQCFTTDTNKTGCVFYDRVDPSQLKSPCSVPKAGCTYYDGSSFTLCNSITDYSGNSVCVQNTTNITADQWYCNCPSEYYGTYCESKNTSFCGTGCPAPPVAICKNTQCVCVDGIHTDTNCTTDICTSTGGTVLVSNETGQSTCQCPDGSSYCPVVNMPSNCTQPGCIKLCPLYNGVQCGQERTFDRSYRCTNRTIYASDSSSPTCDCSKIGTGPSASDTMLYVNSTNGACEPYCLNGGIYSVSHGTCTCTHSGLLQPRCATPACNGRGYIDPASGNCICTQPLDDPSTNCSTSLCNLTGEVAVPNARQCNCSSPYVPDPIASNIHCVDPCAPLGVANLTSRTCHCNASFVTGAQCENTPCIPSTMNFTTDTCTCATGGQWDNVSLSCVDTSFDCVHGVRDSTSKICNCLNFWGGPACDQDICQQSNGNATGSDQTGWSCTCQPGWFVSETTSSGLCSDTYCTPGKPVPCGSSLGYEACVYSHYDFNCRCGLASWFLEGSCIGSCIHGVITRNPAKAPHDLYCACDSGWTGTVCNQKVCDASNERIRFNETTGLCECIPPYFNITKGCTDNLCGVGQNSTGVTDDFVCACNSPFYLLNGTQPYPCVKNCFSEPDSHTDYALENSCACVSGFYGEFCTSSTKVVPTTSSSSTSLPDYAWGLIGTAAGIVLLWILYWTEKRWHWFSRRGWTRVATSPPVQTPVATTAAKTGGAATMRSSRHPRYRFPSMMVTEDEEEPGE